MSNFYIYRDKEKELPIERIQQMCKDLDMEEITEVWFTKESAFEVRITSISDGELATRERIQSDFGSKVMENVYLDENFYFCFCNEENFETIFSFVKNLLTKEIEEFNKKYYPKYTKFRDIPQLTRCGNWECDFTFPELVKYIENEVVEQGLQMNPDFQRGHVWTEKQQIAFIEFFLRGGKTGRVIYLNNPSWNFPNEEYNEYVCVDGLQRYTAIKRFINNEITAFGTYYKDYEDHIRATNTMRLNVNDLQSRKEVLQWYIEFNAGGTPHSDAEIKRVKDLLDKEVERSES